LKYEERRSLRRCRRARGRNAAMQGDHGPPEPWRRPGGIRLDGRRKQGISARNPTPCS
jgi:hypothetical protein